MYPIQLTRLAAAIATTNSVAAVEQRAREELATLPLSDPTKLILHCFRMAGVTTDREFICTPDGAGGIIVDTVTFEPGATFGPSAGKLSGRIAMIPCPDSEPE